MHKVIQNRYHLCREIALARQEAGLSQQALAEKLGVAREKIARLEAGSGSVALLLNVMSEIPIRLQGIAKGLALNDQLVNARAKRKWSVSDLAARCGLDSRTIKQIERGSGTVASLEVILNTLAPRWKRQSIARIYWDFDKAKMAETDCRFTPREFLHAISESFGPIDLDPCWHPSSTVFAQRTISLPDCGLKADWSGTRLAFVNPPYGNLASWIAKANHEWGKGGVEKLLLLFPASRLDIREFFDRTSRHATTLILRERLRFERLDDKGYPAPFALAFACFGCSEDELAGFTMRYPSLVIPPRDPSMP